MWKSPTFSCAVDESCWIFFVSLSPQTNQVFIRLSLQPIGSIHFIMVQSQPNATVEKKKKQFTILNLRPSGYMPQTIEPRIELQWWYEKNLKKHGTPEVRTDGLRSIPCKWALHCCFKVVKLDAPMFGWMLWDQSLLAGRQKFHSQRILNIKKKILYRTNAERILWICQTHISAAILRTLLYIKAPHFNRLTDW